MKLAVTSQNFRTVTPHAGRTRRFIIYEAAPDGEPIEVDRLDLSKELAMHAFHWKGVHPLDAAEVLITASCGPGFVRRMATRGIAVVTSAISDPLEAVRTYLAAARAGMLDQPRLEPHHRRGGAGHERGRGHGHRCGHGHHRTEPRGFESAGRCQSRSSIFESQENQP